MLQLVSIFLTHALQLQVGENFCLDNSDEINVS